MNIRCIFGFHIWDGCVCLSCREDKHLWKNGVCTVCDTSCTHSWMNYSYSHDVEGTYVEYFDRCIHCGHEKSCDS
jgi:hypothetical protein